MKDGRDFIVFWILNSALFYFAPYLLVNLVVTGNVRLSPFMSSIISGFLLTIGIALATPAFSALKIKLTDLWQWILAYLFINVIGVWLVARYADLTGVGVSSAWIAVLLGVMATIFEVASEQLVLKKSK